MAQQDDFYIGWQENMPPSHQKKTKQFVGIVALITILVASLLVIGQKGFADSTFELGNLSQIEGTLQLEPAPSLLVPAPDSELGYQTVLLIGFGKFSAIPTIREIEQSKRESYEGKSIILEGTKIYHRDRQLFELTKGTASFKGLSQVPAINIATPQELGDQTLMGEIYDPKCAFGVMKPGYGKPHRSCAIRCISGGIPPVLHIVDQSGQHDYFLLKGNNGRTINNELLSYVADQVRICGWATQQGDWKILYLDPQEDILRLKPHWMNEPVPLCDNS